MHCHAPPQAAAYGPMGDQSTISNGHKTLPQPTSQYQQQLSYLARSLTRAKTPQIYLESQWYVVGNFISSIRLGPVVDWAEIDGVEPFWIRVSMLSG